MYIYMTEKFIYIEEKKTNTQPIAYLIYISDDMLIYAPQL